MTGLELAERMSVAKVTVDELAAWMIRRPDEVRRWLASERPLPKRLAGELEWHLGVRLIDQRMQASGLPACPWIEEHSAPPWNDDKALKQYSAEIDAHVATCPICQQRSAYGATLPPPPPLPIHFDEGVLGNISPWFVWALCGGIVFFFVGAFWRARDVVAEDVEQVGLYTALAWVTLTAIVWVITRLFARRGA